MGHRAESCATSSSRSDARARTSTKPPSSTLAPVAANAGRANGEKLVTLGHELDLLSFLKERRSQNDYVDIPIPLASLALAVSVRGLQDPNQPSSRPTDVPASALKPIEVKDGSRSQRVRDEPWTCSRCQAELGRLLLRDVAKQPPLAFHTTFLCPECCPPETVEDSAEDAETDGKEPFSPDKMVTYENGFSGWLDKESNIPLPRRSTPPRIQARRKRRHLNGSMSTCDVCMRFIATCSDHVEDLAGPPFAPYVERMCKSCHGNDLPRDEVPDYLFEIQKLVTAAILSAVAIPDTMECDNPMALDFRSAAVLASESYGALSPLVCTDVEQNRELRRFIGLRWHIPLLPRGEGMRDPQSQDPNVIARQQPPSLVRKGYALHSFVGLELDLKTGSLAIPLFIPRGIGHSYHAQTHLIQCVIRRAQQDLAQTNVERKAAGLQPYPDINEIWLINGHNKASRILHRDERLRGMVPLEEYLATHADVTDPTNFPPHRSIMLPWEFLKRYRFYARRFSLDDDLTAIQRLASEDRASAKKKKRHSLDALGNQSSPKEGDWR
ncbi:BQ2448_2928 [Microbotryum intermedium]|uniref:BQ2448_2928 protein n=1 Tax=Microbotryum intermedium TaxID=269621 RepID=A0A238FBW9_9BASI|nr:BQ2448_2928 [Microbotryum intermedium]